MSLTILLFRILAPLLILSFPFIGGLIAAIIDGLDWHITNTDSTTYQYWDKFYNFYYLTIETWIVLRWKYFFTKKLAILLYVYRIVGILLFAFTGTRYYLFLFPNVFESFFLFYTGIWLMLGKEPQLSKRLTLISIIILAIPKIFQEYLMHAKGLADWRYIETSFLPFKYDNFYHQALIVILLMLVVFAIQKNKTSK